MSSNSELRKIKIKEKKHRSMLITRTEEEKLRFPCPREELPEEFVANLRLRLKQEIKMCDTCYFFSEKKFLTKGSSICFRFEIKESV